MQRHLLLVRSYNAETQKVRARRFLTAQQAVCASVFKLHGWRDGPHMGRDTVPRTERTLWQAANKPAPLCQGASSYAEVTL